MVDENGIPEVPELAKELHMDSTEINDQNLVSLAEEEARILENLSKNRRQEAVQLIDSWLADTSGYDQRVWPGLSRDIQQNRLSGGFESMPKPTPTTKATKPSVLSGPTDSMPVNIYVDTEKNQLGVRPTTNGVPSADAYHVPLSDVLDLLRQAAL